MSHQQIIYVTVSKLGTSQQARRIDPMLVLRWASVADGGPT